MVKTILYTVCFTCDKRLVIRHTHTNTHTTLNVFSPLQTHNFMAFLCQTQFVFEVIQRVFTVTTILFKPVLCVTCQLHLVMCRFGLFSENERSHKNMSLFSCTCWKMLRWMDEWISAAYLIYIHFNILNLCISIKTFF